MTIEGWAGSRGFGLCTDASNLGFHLLWIPCHPSPTSSSPLLLWLPLLTKAKVFTEIYKKLQKGVEIVDAFMEGGRLCMLSLPMIHSNLCLPESTHSLSYFQREQRSFCTYSNVHHSTRSQMHTVFIRTFGGSYQQKLFPEDPVAYVRHNI